MSVDDVVQDGIEIKLDKTRRLKYTLKGVRILTKKYGSVQKAVQSLQKFNGEINEELIDNLSMLLFAGLVHEDPDLTQDDVENMIDLRYLNSLPALINTAMSDNLPQDTEPNELGNEQTQPPEK